MLKRIKSSKPLSKKEMTGIYGGGPCGTLKCNCNLVMEELSGSLFTNYISIMILP